MTQWNSLDKSANCTLSGSNLIATMSSGVKGGVRGDTSFASGKKYFEGVFKLGSSSNLGLGFSNSTHVFTNYCGSDLNGWGLYIADGGVYFNGVRIAFDNRATAPWAIAQLAFDIGGKLGWAKWNSGLWNGSATADPASGTGGINLATINAGPYFPTFAADQSGAQVLASFGANGFAYPPPTGFSGLDANSQTYAAASKMLGYALLGPPPTALVASKMLGYALLTPTPAPLTFSRDKRLAYLRR